MNKKINPLKIACIVVWVLQLVAETVAGVYLYMLNVLPDKYFVAAIAVFVVLWLLIGALMFVGHKRGRYENGEGGPGNGRRIVAMILAIVIILVFAAASFVLHDVYTTVTDISGEDEQEVNGVTMAVYVLTDDPAQTIQDAADYSFGLVDGYEQARTGVLLERINGTLGKEVEQVSFTTVSEMIDAFYAGQVQTVILNSAYVQLMEDNGIYTDFSTTTRIVYSQVIGEVEEPDVNPDHVPGATQDNEDEVPEKVEKSITSDSFIVYASGSDTRNTYLTTSRSDVNILIVVNPVTKQVLLVNTPRDYYIGNPSGGGALDKLTHCGIYGISCSMEALGNLYGVDVDYFAQINFTGFETLIDALGGIEVYSDWGFYTGGSNQYWIQKGYNYLDGAKALAFARERYNLPTGDNGRGQNQMKVISAVIQKATSGTTIISNYSAILDSISGMFRTDISTQEITDLVKMQLDDMAQWTIHSYAVTGYGDSRITYSMPGVYAYVMWPNQDTVDHASDLINRVIAGEILTSEDIG